MKKSFILHLDSLEVLDVLTPEQTKELFLAFRDYHLGNEIKLNGLMKAVFTPFRNQFDRDSEKYEIIVERNKINGCKGGRPKKPKEPKKPTGLSGNPDKPKKADNDNDNDNDSKNDKNIFNFKKSLLDLGIEENIISEWLKVRKNKKATNSKTAFEAIQKQIKLSGISANECIRKSVENSWSGFKYEWIKNNSEKKVIYQPKDRIK